MKTIILTIFGMALFCGGAFAAIDSKCLKCICQVESNCNENIGCVMDVGSLSCGPYQIKEAYHTDCKIGGGVNNDWKTCANSMSCSEQCVKNYMERYGTYCTGGRTPTCQDYARIHNGGPKGCTNSATEGYWTKVKACYN